MTAADSRRPHRLAALGPARSPRRKGPRTFDLAALAAVVPDPATVPEAPAPVAGPAPLVVARDPLPVARRRRLEPRIVALTDDAELLLLVMDATGLRALTALDLPPSVLWGMRILVVDSAQAALPAADRPRRSGAPACPVAWAATGTGPEAQRWLARTVRERGTPGSLI